MNFVTSLINIATRIIDLSGSTFNVGFALAIERDNGIFAYADDGFNAKHPVISATNRNFFFLMPDEVSGAQRTNAGVFATYNAKLYAFVKGAHQPTLLNCMINYIKLGCSKNVEINGFTNTIDAAIYDFPNAINKIAGYTAVRLDLTVTINHNIFASEGFMKINECCYRCPCDFTPTKLIFNV